MVDLDKAIRNLLNKDDHWRVWDYRDGQMVEITDQMRETPNAFIADSNRQDTTPR